MVTNTILIIDDESDVRWVLRRILEGDGYQVSEAGNGEEGLELLKKQRFDMCFIAYECPRWTE